MDIKIVCPHCKSKLIVEDDLVGELVACDECNEQFTVQLPAESAGKKSTANTPRVRSEEEQERSSPTRRKADRQEKEVSPNSSADADEEEDYVPVRRRPKPTSSNLAPMIFGSLLVLMTLLVGVGLFYAFGFGTSTGTAGPNGRPSAPGGMRIQLSNPQWIGLGPSFSVNLETTSRRPDPTVYTLRYRSADGSVTGSSTIVQLQFQSRTTVYVNHGGFGRQLTSIWVEDSRVPGQTVSNTIPLN